MEDKYYVYVYLDPRKPGCFSYDHLSFQYEPFYVGKGSRDRSTVHLEQHNIKRNYNAYLNNKLKKLMKEGISPIIIKLIDHAPEAICFQLEIDTIKLIGRKPEGGPLTNIYAGGEGAAKSDDVRRKISESKKEWYRVHGKEAHPMYGKHHSSATKIKMSKPRSHKWSDAQKEKLVKIRCERKPETTLQWRVLSPDGLVYIAHGLGEFCREHGLGQGHMWQVAHGQRKHHKGWRCEIIQSPEPVCKDQ